MPLSFEFKEAPTLPEPAAKLGRVAQVMGQKRGDKDLK